MDIMCGYYMRGLLFSGTGISQSISQDPLQDK
jgi:hypothetical protein